MRQRLQASALALLVVLSACGGAAAPAGGSAAGGDPSWANGLSPASRDALAPLVSAARREGSVVVFGPLGPETAAQLPPAFEKRFGVKVEYTSGAIGDLATRIIAERSASLYSTDVAIGGAQTQATVMWDAKMHDPIRPVLVDPVVTDPAKWKTGKLWFLDPDDKYILRISNSVTPLLAVNPKLVASDELVTARELLDAKWRGRITSTDPRQPGTASNSASLLYIKFGEEFLRKFYGEQKVVIVSMTGERQAAESTARGAYALQFSATQRTVEPMTKQGLDIELRQGFRDLPGYVTSGSGLLALLSKAPHPNAAQLFVNWLAGPEGLANYSRSQTDISNRTDVDESWSLDINRRKPNVDYFDSYDWEYTIKTKPQTIQILKKLLPN